MFCPNAAEWGNVADWVSGIGSMLAVFAAIGVASWETLRTGRVERRNNKIALRMLQSVVGSAKSLLEEATERANEIGKDLDDPGILSQATKGLKNEYVRLQAATAERLRQLQQLERSHPELYVEIGYIASLLDIADDPNTTHDVVFGVNARGLYSELVKEKGKLEDIYELLLTDHAMDERA